MLSAALFLVLTVLAGVRNEIALAESKSATVQFTFDPSLTLTIDGTRDMTVPSMTPGQSNKSNEVTLKVVTNNAAGYSVTATVGATNNASTSLKRTDGSELFTAVSSNKATKTKIGSFGNNTWGFAYTTGSWAADANIDYYGLPLDTGTNDTTKAQAGLEILGSSTPTASTGATVKCRIAVKVGPTQPAGTYNNTVHFYVVTK